MIDPAPKPCAIALLRFAIGSLPAALLLLLPLSPAAAQQPPPAEPLVTDRPDFTESAFTVDRFQAESGYTYTHSPGGVREHAIGELLLRVPVRRGAELRLGLNSFSRVHSPDARQQGLEDASVGIKLALREARGWLPAAALLASTTLPTGGDAFRERRLQPGATLAASWNLSARWGLGSNIGYTYASEAEQRFGQMAGSVALSAAVTERLGSYVEAFGVAPQTRGGADTGFFNGGFTFGISPDLQVDARAGRQWSGGDSYFVGIGIARRW